MVQYNPIPDLLITKFVFPILFIFPNFEISFKICDFVKSRVDSLSFKLLD